LSLSSVVPAVYAQESSTASSATSVDCDAVMQALGQGKTMREVASDMKISVGRVRGCKKRAARAAKAENKTSPGNTERMNRSNAARAAGSAPGAEASPGAEAPPAAPPATTP
jgi:DNA-binding NarL/FixJ family response regulator